MKFLYIFGVIVSLISALTFSVYKYISVVKQLENETYKNLMLESKLALQNQEIQKMSLDTKNYKENKEKQEKEIKNKYEKILHENKKIIVNKCDLKEFQRLKKQEAKLKDILKARYE